MVSQALLLPAGQAVVETFAQGCLQVVTETGLKVQVAVEIVSHVAAESELQVVSGTAPLVAAETELQAVAVSKVAARTEQQVAAYVLKEQELTSCEGNVCS